MSFDTIAMLDWSGGNDTGPTPCADAIWLAVQRGDVAEAPVYLRNRVLAEETLTALIEAELAAGRRLLLGVDFPFGYPAGVARALAGSDDPLALWAWLERQVKDTPERNNRFDLAGDMNRRIAGSGPFWGNGLKRDIEGLPRTRAGYANPFPERRACEYVAKGAFPVWQLSGAGAVGSQVLTGLPVLERLRARFADQAAVWPFQPLDRALAFVEVWPSLIAPVIGALQHDEEKKDAAQVRVLAAAVARLSAEGRLDALLADVPEGAPRQEEGWILGLGHEAALGDAARAACGSAGIAPPPLSNNCFALPQGVSWTPVDDALAHLGNTLHVVTGTERAPVASAAGRILAAPVAAPRANPPAPNSAVDGYGFAAAHLGDPPHLLPLEPGRAAAGAAFDGVVRPGHAVRILTGAVLPEGVDTVVLEEDCTAEPTRIAFQGGLKPRANTRPAGEDVLAGAEVLPAARRLTPADLALLSAVGVSEVSVHRRLRVGVLSTGDEIVAPGSVADPDRTYDANRPMLLALAERWGHCPVDLGHVGDDRDALRRRLDTAETDAILTSGGASAGDEDHVSALLGEAGSRAIWRIAVKPGRPLALGVWNGAAVFGLPGNPVAAFVCALVFARPALSLMAGAGWIAPQGFTVPAAFAKRKKPGRREYLRARLDPDGRAEVFASEGSGRVSGLSWAEGLVELPDGAVTVEPGDPVRYLPFSGFGL